MNETVLSLTILSQAKRDWNNAYFRVFGWRRLLLFFYGDWIEILCDTAGVSKSAYLRTLDPHPLAFDPEAA